MKRYYVAFRDSRGQLYLRMEESSLAKAQELADEINGLNPLPHIGMFVPHEVEDTSCAYDLAVSPAYSSPATVQPSRTADGN